MARAVEAVTADRIFLIVLRINAVEVCVRFHSHTECCIEYSNVRLARHSCLTCLDTHKVRRIMKRSEREALFDNFLYLRVYQCGLCELETAMEYAMAYCRNLVYAGNNAVVCIYQSVENEFNSFFVCRHGSFYSIIFLARNLMCKHGSVDTDSLTQTFCLNGLICCINQLVLE